MKYVEFTTDDFELALAEDRKDMKIDYLLSLMALAGMCFIIALLIWRRNFMGDALTRPGRKDAANKRKQARIVIEKILETEEFRALPRSIQLAILTLNPSLKEPYWFFIIPLYALSASHIIYDRQNSFY